MSFAPKSSTPPDGSAILGTARIGKVGRRPATARELVLLALLIMSTILLTQHRQIASVVTDSGYHHKIT